MFSSFSLPDDIKDKGVYMRELVYLEDHFAAKQTDVGLVKDYPFSMEVKPGPPIRQKPIRYLKEQE